MSRKRDWRIFVVFAVLGGALLVFAGIMMFISMVDTAYAEGEILEFADILPCIFVGLLGVALAIGSVVVFRTFGNTNMGKRDTSLVVTYRMQTSRGVEVLSHLSMLRYEVAQLNPNEEVTVTLSPEYFGLVAWKFFRIKDVYMSFVRIHKKDKYVDYFIMPRTDVDEALQPFREVFEERYAVNTSNLIEMKRYQAVLEYYNLVP